MSLKAHLARQLRGDEGVKEHAYKDSLGYWTIGVGRLIDKRKGGRLRPNEIEFLLQNDIDETLAQLREKLPWFDGLDEARQGALVNMAFQLGVDGLMGFKHTLDAIRDERYAHAANLMLRSLWAKQTPERARRMSRQIETGEWQS